MTFEQLIAKLQSYVFTNALGLITGAKMQEILIDIVTYAFHTENFANDVRGVAISDSMSDNPIQAPTVDALKNFLVFSYLVDNLTTQDTTKALTAQQGYELKELIDQLTSDFSYLVIDDLVTGGSNKALSAQQGLVIVDMIEDLQTQISLKASQLDLDATNTRIDNLEDEVALKALQSVVDAVVANLQAQIDLKVEQADIDAAITALKDGVAAPGDSLQKLYNLIQAAFSEVTVADIAARNAYNVTHLPTHIFVTNDGDGNWALYKATSTGVGASFVKLSDPDLLNAVMSNSQIKAAYESNPDTNAFTNALLTKLNGIQANANNYVHPNHTGDVTSTGDGATLISNGAVSNAKMANMPTLTIKGRATIGAGVPEDLNAAQVTDLLNGFTSLLKGLVPASGGGIINFLRADGSWANPLPVGQEVESSTNTTTTSTTDVLLTGMTITPGAGTYLVLFTGCSTNNTLSASNEVSLYLDGVRQNTTARRKNNDSVVSGTILQGVHAFAKKVTVSAGQTIEVRWKVSAGTGTFNERILTLFNYQ